MRSVGRPDAPPGVLVVVDGERQPVAPGQDRVEERVAESEPSPEKPARRTDIGIRQRAVLRRAPQDRRAFFALRSVGPSVS